MATAKEFIPFIMQMRADRRAGTTHFQLVQLSRAHFGRNNQYPTDSFKSDWIHSLFEERAFCEKDFG